MIMHRIIVKKEKYMCKYGLCVQVFSLIYVPLFPAILNNTKKKKKKRTPIRVFSNRLFSSNITSAFKKYSYLPYTNIYPKKILDLWIGSVTNIIRKNKVYNFLHSLILLMIWDLLVHIMLIHIIFFFKIEDF